MVYRCDDALFARGLGFVSIEEELLAACASNDLEKAKSLLLMGADANVCDIHAYDAFKSPLNNAARLNSLGLIKLLVKHGARLELTGDGESGVALHTAAYYGSDKAVALLLSLGAKIDYRDGSKRAPLHMAVTGANLGSTRLLLAAGAYVNARDVNGNTPLHHAASMQHHSGRDIRAEIVRELLAAGARVNSKNAAGATPIYMAIKSKNEKNALLLAEHGASLSGVSRICLDRDFFAELKVLSETSRLKRKVASSSRRPGNEVGL